MAGLLDRNEIPLSELLQSTTTSFDFETQFSCPITLKWEPSSLGMDSATKLWAPKSPVRHPDLNSFFPIRNAFSFTDPLDVPRNIPSPEEVQRFPISVPVPELFRDFPPLRPPSGSNLKASDVYTFATENLQYVHQECIFVIQLLNGAAIPTHTRRRRGVLATFPKSIKAKYFDPFGFEHTAQVKHVNWSHNLFQGSFYPPVPGNYIVSVFHVEPNSFSPVVGSPVDQNPSLGNFATNSQRNHVCGSPFSIRVSRNYMMESRRVLLSIGLFGLSDSGRNPCRCWGLTSNSHNDNFYITNRELHNVSVFDSHGRFLSKFGHNVDSFMMSDSVENLYRPTGIVCDSFNNRILVADKDNHRIAIYSLDGSFINSFGEFGHDEGQLNFPWDVDCSSTGDRIIVSDSRNHRIQTFDRFGNFIGKFSAFESDPIQYKNLLDNPRGITFDVDDKNIFVTDFNQERVTKINADLTEGEKLRCDQPFGRLQGITVDPIGNLLVCDTRRNVVRAIDPEGKVIASIGTLENIILSQPLDVTVMTGGRVAILDFEGRVRVF